MTKTISKRELYTILDWHYNHDYDIECEWSWHYTEQGQQSIQLRWLNPLRQIEYWLTVI